MALQELSKRELAGLVAGVTAASAIIDRIKAEEPEELPKDEIRQWEIKALLAVEAITDAMALGLKRRLEAGATVQPGPYFLEADTDSLEDLAERLEEGGTNEFNCAGFSAIGYREIEPERPAPAKRTGRVIKRRRK